MNSNVGKSSSSSSSSSIRKNGNGPYVNFFEEDPFNPKKNLASSSSSSSTSSSKPKKDQEGPGPGTSKRLNVLDNGLPPRGPAGPKKPKVVNPIPKGKQRSPTGMSDEGFELEEEEFLAGAHVKQLLNQVKSQMKNKAKAKNQKYSLLFKSADSISNRIKALQKEQTDRKDALMEQFKKHLEEVTVKLKEATQVQLNTDEKLTKMGTILSREQGDLKQKIQDVAKDQKKLSEKLNETNEKLDRHFEETKQQIQEIDKSVKFLFKKMLADSQKEGSEAFKRFF